MINKKYQHFVFSFYMALMMSCLMSFVISLLNVGFVSNIFFIWIKAWFFAFLIAYPSVVVIYPIVKKLVDITIK